MADFTLPENSKVNKGNIFKADEGAKNIRKFLVYRYDPNDDSNPRIDTYEIDLDQCGPMVLDALIHIKDKQQHHFHHRLSLSHLGKRPFLLKKNNGL